MVFPSDTVYGFLADATNEKAVRKLIAFKNRPYGKPISVFVSGFDMLEQEARINERQRKLLNTLLPGPFTVILESRHAVSPLLESEKGTLGLRLPDYPLIQKLVARYGKPVTATSANISGRKPHYQISALVNELSKEKKELIDLVVDGGMLPRNKPSTILDLTSPTIRTLRKGDILFTSSQRFVSDSPQQTEKIASYLLKKHEKTLSDKPLVFILEGEVGAGKTVFAKGIGKSLGIDNVISPTYVVYYEYPLQKANIQYLYHFDLYNIEEEKELEQLKVAQLLKKHTILLFEWGEKIASLLPLLQEKAIVYFVTISYTDETVREIEIKQ